MNKGQKKTSESAGKFFNHPSLPELMSALPQEYDKTLRKVWETFFTISLDCPRPSGGEEKIRKFLLWYGEEMYRNNVIAEEDLEGNILWKLPASSQSFDNPEKSILFTAHMDMVCFPAADNPESPARKGVIPEVIKPANGAWYVQSKGQKTTLGADNGAMLAVMAQLPELLKNKQHGRIGLLFTSSEETTMKGARGIGFNLDDYKYAINLDRSKENCIDIGATGTQETSIILPVNHIPSHPIQLFLQINGLRGGHSGNDMHDPTRQSALKITAKILDEFKNKGANFNIISLKSNGPMNAIPAAAETTIAVNHTRQRMLYEIITKTIESIQKEEKNLTITCEKASLNNTMLDNDSSTRLLDLLNIFPHGVLNWGKNINGQYPKTSINLAQVLFSPDQKEVQIKLKSRSFYKSALTELGKKLKETAQKYKAIAEYSSLIPVWQARQNTSLSKIVREAYKEVTHGKQMEERMAPSTLEPSYLIHNYQQFDGNTVAIGPNIKDEHTKTERVEGESLEKIVKVVIKTIQKIAILSG
jgi:dipeptidase D